MFEQSDCPPGDEPDPSDGSRAAAPRSISVPMVPAGVGTEVVRVLAGLDARELSVDARIELVAALGRQVAWIQALQVKALAVAVGPTDDPLVFGDGIIASPAREEFATALHITARAAQQLIDTALRLTHHLPATAACLAAGAISYRHAQTMVETIGDHEVFTADQLAKIEKRVLGRAGHQSPTAFKQCVRRAIASIAPSYAAQRCTRAALGRRVGIWGEEDGMACITALLPYRAARDVYEAIDKAAHVHLDELKLAGVDGPGIGAARADMLVEIVTRTTTTRPAAVTEATPPPTRVAAVVLDLATALGLADNPGEVPGYGPVPGPIARQLAADCDWVRWITDPISAHLLDAGRTRYQPSPALRDYICARDGTCRFPGCTQSAFRSDVDHATAWEADGETSRENLGALCRRHHRMKTINHWQLTNSQTDGSCTWTSPTGRKHDYPPQQPLPGQVQPYQRR